MPAPLITLPAVVVQAGVYRHFILRASVPEPLPADGCAIVHPEVCETLLPADFCACGAWMLFVPDDFPDAAPPASPPETPPCPPDSAPPSPA